MPTLFMPWWIETAPLLIIGAFWVLLLLREVFKDESGNLPFDHLKPEL